MLAFVRVDVCQCAAHLDSVKRTFFETFLAANATDIAVLHGDSSFLDVDAAYVDSAVVLALRTDFYDTARTSLSTCSAAYAFVFVNDGDTFFLVYVDGVEGAFLDTVAETETCVRTSAAASIKGMCESADVGSLIMCFLWRIDASAVATYYSNLRFGSFYSETKNASYFRHVGTRTEQTVDIALASSRLYTSLGKSATSGKTATSAVGT